MAAAREALRPDPAFVLHEPPSALLRTAGAADRETPRRYATIVVPELWVPADFPHVLELRDLRGNRVAVGSVDELLRELRLLNDRVLHVDEAKLNRSAVSPSVGDSIAANATFGLAVMLDLAREAVDRRLPMVLDY